MRATMASNTGRVSPAEREITLRTSLVALWPDRASSSSRRSAAIIWPRSATVLSGIALCCLPASHATIPFCPLSCQQECKFLTGEPMRRFTSSWANGGRRSQGWTPAACRSASLARNGTSSPDTVSMSPRRSIARWRSRPPGQNVASTSGRGRLTRLENPASCSAFASSGWNISSSIDTEFAPPARNTPTMSACCGRA